MHAAGIHTGTMNREKNRDTKERVCLYMFSELSAGSNGSFGLSRPETHTDRLVSKTITTHLHQEEGVREEGLTDLNTNTDGGSTRLKTTIKQCFRQERKMREKVKRQKESPEDKINVTG